MRRVPRIALVLLWLGVLLPFAFLLALSFGRVWLFPRLLPAGWDAAAWLGLASGSSALGAGLWQSLALALPLALGSTVLGFYTARALAGRPRTWLLLAYLPYLFSPLIYAACLQVYFNYFALTGKSLGVAVAQFLLAYPYAVIFFSTFWNARLADLEAVARGLGAGPWQVFRWVLLPVALGPLALCFFQTFLLSWFEYGFSAVLGLGQVQTLVVLVFQYVQEGNTAQAAAASSLLIWPPLLFLLFGKRSGWRASAFG